MTFAAEFVSDSAQFGQIQPIKCIFMHIFMPKPPPVRFAWSQELSHSHRWVAERRDKEQQRKKKKVTSKKLQKFSASCWTNPCWERAQKIRALKYKINKNK